MEYDVIVVGGGCAGISAAIYSASRGRKTMLIEQNPSVGGEILQISTITHFAGAFNGESGPDLAARMWEQLQKYDVCVTRATVTSAQLEGPQKVILTSAGECLSKNVIIASGTTQNELNCPNGELLSRVSSHCAHRDGSKYAQKDVLVVGGSDGAAKEALYLCKTAKKVTMIVLEPKLSAISQFSDHIANTPNIHVITDSSILDVHGDGCLKQVEIINNKTKAVTKLDTPEGGIFVYIGSTPNTGWCHGLQLENGYIVADENMRSSLPNVYAAGDVRAKTVRQISTAVSDGTIAAIDTCSCL